MPVDFDELYARYGTPLYVFIYRYVKSHPEAEEILQETFMKLMAHETEIHSVQAWLYTVARREALNRLRRERRPQLEIVSMPDEGWHLEEKWLAGEIDTLPIGQREVYRQRSAGRSYREIATAMGVPEGTVKSRLHEAVQILRKRWKVWNAN